MRSDEPDRPRYALRDAIDATWRSARFAAGMGILAAVFVVSHALVLAEALTHVTPATDVEAG